MSNSEGTAHDGEHDADLRQQFGEIARHLDDLNGLRQQVSVAISDWIEERRSTDRIATDLTALSRQLAEAHSNALHGMRLLAEFKREAQPVTDELRAVMAQSKSATESMVALVDGWRIRVDSDFGRLQASVGRLEPLVQTIGETGRSLTEVVDGQRRIARDLEAVRGLVSVPSAGAVSREELLGAAALLAALGVVLALVNPWLAVVAFPMVGARSLAERLRGMREAG